MDASRQVIRPEAGIDPTMGTQICDSQRDNGLLSTAMGGGDAAGRTPWTGGPALRVVHASGIADAFAVIRDVRCNQAVLLNCGQLDIRLGRRLNDICSGGVSAMDGQVHRISAELVLFAPAMAKVTCA
ncbi:MAG: Cell division protein SepF [Cyanobacteriota bacterium]|jgi:hypothetical protein